MEGWIKIHRKIWENPIVSKDSDHIAVWVWLITHAVFKNTKINFAGKIIMLLPGQLTTSRQIIAEDCEINRSKVERILKLFKNEHQIEQQTTNQCRLITIKNWNLYQESEQQIEQRVSNKRATSEQRVSTNKECKELKESKKDTYAKLEKFWKSYPKKKSKEQFKKAWNKLTEKDRDLALSVIDKHKQQDDWQKDQGRFIPYAGTWINQKRFNDELEPVTINDKWGGQESGFMN